MELSAVIWMFVILKIPILAALWLIWYAVQEPEPTVEESDERGGGSDPVSYTHLTLPTTPYV